MQSGFGERGLAAIVLVLAAVAGYLDAVGWALFAHVYVANMTGNTVALARGLAERDLTEAAARMWPIFVFTLGLLSSELLYLLAQRRGRRSSACWTLGIEAVASSLVVILPWTRVAGAAGIAFYAPVGLLSFAMGLQNATLVRVGASSVYTTHLTGNLTRLGREGAHALVYLRERGAGDEQGRRSLRRVALMALLWLAYLMGALAGSAAAEAWQGRAVAFAVVVLLGLVIVDVVRPIGGHEPPDEPHPMF